MVKGHELFSQMRDLLAKLYLDRDSAITVAKDAGLDLRSIAFSTHAINNWRVILEAAEKRDLVSAILDIAIDQFPEMQELLNIRSAYHCWIEKGRPGADVVSAPARPDPLVQPWQDNGGGQTIIERPDSIIELIEPRIPRHFKDRAKEVNTLLHLVREKTFCGIFGIDGTGKTILAAYVANKIRKSGDLQVIWLSHNKEILLEQTLETLAQSIGHSLRTIPDANKRYAYLRGITEGKGLLIIFDDANQDIILDRFLDSIGAGNAVIITSHNQGLKSIRKFGLEVVHLESLPAEAATEVLLELSGMLTSTAIDFTSWQTLAQAVGNLPLALEIIAGDLRFRSNNDPTVYLNSQVITRKWLKNEEAEEHIYGALQESIEQLPQNYRIAFACLGVFFGDGLDTSAVKAVCNFDSNESTEEFLIAIRKRMLLCAGLDGTLSLHPIVRQFAQDQLNTLEIDTQSDDSPTGKYIEFYYQKLLQFGGYEWNISQYFNLIPYESEIINAIKSAYSLWINREVAARETFGKIVINMTFYVSWYLLWRGYWDLRIQLCRQITDELEKSGLLQDKFGRFSNIAGNLYIDRGWNYLRRGEYGKARHCVARAKPLMRAIDRKFAIELEAQLALKMGNSQKAFELFSELRDQEKVNTRQWFVFSYRLSDSLVELGRSEEAINLLKELLTHIQSVVIFQNEIISDTHACIAYRLAMLSKGDNLKASRRLLKDSVQLFKESGIVDQTTISAQIELAEILRSSDASSQSSALLNEALRQARTIGELKLTTRIENMLQSISDE
jgi:tetratricopeptide (TPR) repeat protein